MISITRTAKGVVLVHPDDEDPSVEAEIAREWRAFVHANPDLPELDMTDPVIVFDGKTWSQTFFYAPAVVPR